jgi:hypothetical protein
MNKMAAEVRFNGQLSILEKIHEIVKIYFPKELPHWRIDNGNSARIYNEDAIEKASEIILIDSSRFIYTVENASTDDYFISRYLKFYKLFEKYIEIDSIARIGYRNITLIDQESKEKTLARYSDIFLKSFINRFGESAPIDYYNVLEYETKRITFGPLAKSEKDNSYWNEFNNKELIRDNMFLIDIDIFQKNVTKKDVSRTLDTCSTENKDYMKKVCEMFGR